MITHRPFTTMIRKSVGNGYGNEEKVSDLLGRLELNARITTRVEETENINSTLIDYSRTDRILQKCRENAKQYLTLQIEESGK